MAEKDALRERAERIEAELIAVMMRAERHTWLADTAEQMVPIIERHLREIRPAWQPISTAPKDGSMFLSCRSSTDGPLVVYTSWYGKRHGYWLTTHDRVIEPLFWMPLPAPPEVEVSK